MAKVPTESMTIGALAVAGGVNVETVRYYQRQKLLATPMRRRGGFRHYGDDDLRRLQFIRRAQVLGFSLQEIARLLALEREQSCAGAQALAAAKLVVIRDRLSDLRRLERVLKGLVHQCATSRGRVACPIIESLSRTSGRAP